MFASSLKPTPDGLVKSSRSSIQGHMNNASGDLSEAVVALAFATPDAYVPELVDGIVTMACDRTSRAALNIPFGLERVYRLSDKSYPWEATSADDVESMCLAAASAGETILWAMSLLHPTVDPVSLLTVRARQYAEHGRPLADMGATRVGWAGRLGQTEDLAVEFGETRRSLSLKTLRADAPTVNVGTTVFAKEWLQFARGTVDDVETPDQAAAALLHMWRAAQTDDHLARLGRLMLNHAVAATVPTLLIHHAEDGRAGRSRFAVLPDVGPLSSIILQQSKRRKSRIDIISPAWAKPVSLVFGDSEGGSSGALRSSGKAPIQNFVSDGVWSAALDADGIPASRPVPPRRQALAAECFTWAA